MDHAAADSRMFGRQVELAAITAALADRSAAVGGVVLQGEAGIGKTTVWAAGVEQAAGQGWAVLSTRGNQSEAGLSFAGLTDLFDPVVDAVVDQLAELQQLALEVALLRRQPGDSVVGAREIGAATLATLRVLCAHEPVLLAVDDVQWVDHATLDALRFALRRLDTGPLRILATQRTGGAVVDAAPAPESLAPMAVIPVGPLDPSIARQLLADRLELDLPDRVLEGLMAQTQGNPFWVLELGAALRLDSPARPVTIPESLAVVVAQRLEAFAPDTRQALLVVSALPEPPIAVAIRALAPVVTDASAALDYAVAAGAIVEHGGRLRPAHPLLGSAALDSMPPVARRALHARLASVVADDEQRARHVALAAHDAHDAVVAAGLDAGAVAARSRGATQAAAELAAQAVTFTPPDDSNGLVRRWVTTAELYLQAADIGGAQVAASAAWRQTDPDRRRALPLLVEATYWLAGNDAARQIIVPILNDQDADTHTRAIALAMAADIGDGTDTPRGELAQAALDLFAQVDGEPDPVAMSIALTHLALGRLDAGEGIAFDVMHRAGELQRGLPHVLATQRADFVVACWYRHVDELDEARSALRAAIAEAHDRGDDSALPSLYGNLAVSEVWAGRYAAAREAVAGGLARFAGTGSVPGPLQYADVVLRLLTGEVAAVRSVIADRLAGGSELQHEADRIIWGNLRGLAALLDGDAESAVECLSETYSLARRAGKHEPGRRYRPESDLGQALVATGRLDEASALADEQVALGERTGRPTLTGIGLRIRGLVLAARGDLSDAATVLSQAVAAHEGSPLPLEHGRSLLALAHVQRRRKLKAEPLRLARAALDRFVELGAAAFAQQAHTELDRLQRTRSGAMLTRAEQQIAELVADGATNREVAGQLFASVRTVEGHLSSIYRKLGVRSRTELTKRYNAGEVDG